MAFAKKQTAVVYIDTDKALFYTGKTVDIFRLDFPSNVISDLDLVSEEKLTELIDSFCKTNNLEGTKYETTLVFSTGSVFEKDFADENKEENTQMQQFIDIVPFEDVLSKTYKLDKKTKVVVINKTLYEALKNALEKKNFSISSVLPYSVLQEINTELANSVNLAFIAGKIDSYKQYNLNDSENNNSNNKIKTNDSKKQNKRVYILIGIFILLLILLGVLVISTLSPQQSSKKGTVVLPTLTPRPSIQKENTASASPSANISATGSPTVIPTVSQ